MPFALCRVGGDSLSVVFQLVEQAGDVFLIMLVFARDNGGEVDGETECHVLGCQKMGDPLAELLGLRGVLPLWLEFGINNLDTISVNVDGIGLEPEGLG